MLEKYHYSRHGTHRAYINFNSITPMPTKKTIKKVAAKKTVKKAAKKAPAKKAVKTTAKKAAVKKAPAKKVPTQKAKPTSEAIAKVAYLNYRRRMELGLPGDAASDWLTAERSLA